MAPVSWSFFGSSGLILIGLAFVAFEGTRPASAARADAGVTTAGTSGGGDGGAHNSTPPSPSTSRPVSTEFKASQDAEEEKEAESIGVPNETEEEQTRADDISDHGVNVMDDADDNGTNPVSELPPPSPSEQQGGTLTYGGDYHRRRNDSRPVKHPPSFWGRVRGRFGCFGGRPKDRLKAAVCEVTPIPRNETGLLLPDPLWWNENIKRPKENRKCTPDVLKLEMFEEYEDWINHGWNKTLSTRAMKIVGYLMGLACSGGNASRVGRFFRDLEGEVFWKLRFRRDVKCAENERERYWVFVSKLEGVSLGMQRLACAALKRHSAEFSVPEQQNDSESTQGGTR